MLTQIRSPSRVYQPAEFRPSMAMVCLPRTNLASPGSLSLSSQHHNLTIATQIKQKKGVPFMAQYLISSFSFPEVRALRIASDAHFRAIKTRDRPDSVVHFFKDIGLTNREIQVLISWNPWLLSSNVEKTLKPRASELMAAGFTGNTFIQLIKYNPLALNRKNTLSVLQFWRRFLNNNEKALLRFIKMNLGIMFHDMDKQIIPKMNLLHDYGLSDKQIALLLMRVKGFMRRSPDKIKLLLEKTENLGFQQGSRMFFHGLVMVGCLNQDTIERKIKLFKNTYNWSEEEISRAIKRCPYIIKLSEENLKSTVDFLVAKFGFDARGVAQQPSILTYSLKGRIIPRHYVMNVLKSKGVQINCCARYVIMMTEEMFFEKLIEPYKEEVPELGDSYAAFLDGKMSK